MRCDNQTASRAGSCDARITSAIAMTATDLSCECIAC
jgi:hypothetical protein